jgi:hypothetical protein
MTFLKTETFKTLVKNQKFETIEQANTALPHLINAIVSLQMENIGSISEARIKREILWQSDGATPEVAEALKKLAKELGL